MTRISKLSLVATSSLAAVLLAGCVSRSDYDAVVSQNNQLQSKVATQQAQITRLQGAIKYTLESDLLFNSGSWTVSPTGKRIIGSLAAQLAPTQENKLYVNGFTDNAPIGPGLLRQGVSTNEELSQKRAEAVMEYMISQGVKSDMIAAKGHGESNPVAPNDTAAGRSKNRRVEITLTPL